MAKTSAANPATLLGDATRYADLRQRLLFLIGALVVYRIGTFIPVPGIDPVALQQFFQQHGFAIARTMCWRLASTEAGFETMPTRLFSSAPDASSRSDPSRTLACVIESAPLDGWPSS